MQSRFRKLLVATALCVPGIAAMPQQAPAGSRELPAAVPECSGMLGIIRVSEITTDGSIDKFLTAIAAQSSWYAAHGLSDRIFASRMLVHDPDKNSYSYSKKQVLSYHFYSPATLFTTPAHDQAWEKFVKMFEETAEVKESAYTCVPNGAMLPLAK